MLPITRYYRLLKSKYILSPQMNTRLLSVLPTNELSIQKLSVKSVAVKSLSKVKEYKPPANCTEQVFNIAGALGIKSFQTKLDTSLKHKLLNICISSDMHKDIPNPVLNDLQTVYQIAEYFSSEIDSRSISEKVADSVTDLNNVHFEVEYSRFKDIQSKWYDGNDAFPDRDTLVTSLWYGRKYKSYIKSEN
ncbi:hypothetical protein GJ496_011906 [Pomphorhynchus laevis]|nr:hypothetical protein GJ496_011906 [Pomphorhynchus laevis]